MNTTHTPPPIDEHDWQAQERSLDAPSRRPEVLLARALGDLPVSRPPPDFAAAVARLATTRVARQDDAALERVLQPLLFAVLALGAVIAALVYGGAIWTATLDVFGAGASQWLLVAGACIALAAAPDAMRRFTGEPASEAA